jgi:hypothetical protein
MPAFDTYSHDQYLRKWTLSLGGSGGGSLTGTGSAGGELVLTTETQGLDLRMRFDIRQADVQTPNTAIIRVYNLSDDTARSVIDEFDQVTLQAGYITGNYGVIFKGTIKQYKRGRESAIDSYLDIFAADGDQAHNEATVNKTLAAKSTLQTQADELRKSQQAAQPGLGVGNATPSGLPGGVLPRGRVLYGMTADEIRTWQQNAGASWTIQDGQVEVRGLKEYSPGEVVVLTAQTGLVGVPEATQDGIHVTCFLNPAIKVRGRVQLDNSGINQYFVPGGAPVQGQASSVFPSYTSMNFFASPSADGTYCVLVIDYEGDTRGLPWYNKMVCLAVDSSSPLGSAVQGIGGFGGSP